MLSYQVENTAFPSAKSVAGIDRETMTMVTLPLEALYQRGSRVARANAEVRATRADAERDRQRTGLDAAQTFYRVALARVTVATNDDLTRWLDSVVAYNRARVKEGATAEADLIRSQLERDRAAAEATMALAELAQARAQLAVFLDSREPSGELDVAVADTPLAVPTSASAPGALSVPLGLDARPDVRAARERVTAATAGISTERRLLIGDLGATLGAKQMMGTTSMIAGLSLPLPLFNQNRGEIARATAERDVARYDLLNQERIAAADVVGAEASARLLTARATELARGGPESFLARAEEARRIALGAYREGAIPLIQVSDAARTWGDARSTFYRTLYAQHQSVLALIVARGGDLFSSSLTPAPAAPGR